MADLTAEEGAMLVRAARQSILDALEGRAAKAPSGPAIFLEERGVFVTLSTFPGEELRGCVGFVQGVGPLGQAVVDAARLAAFEDGRFEPVRKAELERLIVEVSVLTPPKRLAAQETGERLRTIRIGEDGLILKYGRSSGLLLPQVAIEWNFTPQTFLEAVCEKAGLPKDMWKSPSASIWTFGAQVFAERKPGGAVSRRALIR